jgi:hypothetical protein
MSFAISVLAQKRHDCELEVKRINQLPNKNKDKFIKMEESKIQELDKAIQILLKHDS